MKQTQTGTLTQLTATDGYINKIGTDIYAKSIIMLPGDTIDMYREVANKPAYTKAEYDTKVTELVRQRYTLDEEFAIQRKVLNIILSPDPLTMNETEQTEYHEVDEFMEYNTWVESCKEKAKDANMYNETRVIYDNIEITEL